MKIKVSVIIPVYNAEKYLKECLDSVTNQTMEEIEIICINDGSSDKSLQILQEFSFVDNRVCIVSQENKGLSATRNLGVNMAKGEYVYYLDSDDYIRCDALDVLYKRATEDDLDILFFDAYTKYDSLSMEKMYQNYKNEYCREYIYPNVCSGKELFKKFMYNEEYKVSSCLQFAKKDYIIKENLQFYDGIVYEDNLYTLKGILNAERVGYLNKRLYYRRIREGSIITTEKNSFEHFYSAFNVYIEELKIMFELEGEDLKVLVASLVEEMFIKMKKLYMSIEDRALSMNEIQLYNNMPEINKMLLKQLGFSFNIIPRLPFENIPKNSQVVLYGAGNIGREYKRQIERSRHCTIVCWVDRRYKELSVELGEKVVSIEELDSYRYDYILLAIENKVNAMQVSSYLQKRNIDSKLIKWQPVYYINK